MTSELYQLGRWAHGMPIPPVREHAAVIDAGPLRFVIEARQFTDDLAAEIAAQRGIPARPRGRDDFGPSLHVLGAESDIEHLRFDCFTKDPHYHYIYHDRRANLVCRFDDIANGEPVSWVVGRLYERLPEMLEFIEQPGLAAATRENWPDVTAGVGQVAELMVQAGRQAKEERLTRSKMEG